MYFSVNLFINLVFNILLYSYTTASIPSYIHVCHKSDPKVNQCIIDSIEKLKPKLKDGIPELKVPSIEPLPLNKIILRAGPNQAQINADFINVNVWDVSLFQITDLRADFKKQIILVKVDLPHLNFKGDYDVDMNLLILKYKGKGIITGNFTDYKVDLTLKFDLIKKDGKDYINFQKVGIRLYPLKSIIRLEGLFNNDQTLSKGVEEVVRDNSDLFVHEVLPILEEGISVRLTEIANNIAHTYPYEDLLPE